MILEFLLHIFIEIIFIDFIFPGIAKLNNVVLRLRGKETRNVQFLKLARIKKRYARKKVRLKRKFDKLEKGSVGVVLDVIDRSTCLVKFELNKDVMLVEVPRRFLLVI